MVKKNKVIIFVHLIQHYRVVIYNLISQNYDLTICTTNKNQIEELEKENFKVLFLPTNNIGPFLIYKKNIHRLVRDYDVAIGLMNLRCIDIMTLPFNPFIKTKIIFWGIGVSASYTKNFDQDKKIDFLRFLFFRKADGLIFYTEYPKQKYLNKGFDKESLFVANNTIKVLPIREISPTNKKDFVFIGSLYVEKGIKELLESYLLAYNVVGDSLNRLIIIGKGEERSYIENFIKENKMENKIILKGAIYNQEVLKSYFEKSILCISPKQAGLSVLMSMGYATCFITRNDAITGGEILNIKHEITGILYNKDEELVRNLIEAHNNPNKFISIGNNAKKYYESERRPEQMARGISNAINYVAN